MLITILKGRRKQAALRPFRRTVRSRSSVVDVSGPLPAPPAPRDPAAPYREALASASQRRSAWRQNRTEMSDLPREIDPFESDFPWIGWTEPRHESVIRSDHRSPTFERDLQRVLRIFAN